jgi:hypothetical protein
MSQQSDYRSPRWRPATKRPGRFIPAFIRLTAIILVGGFIAWAMDAYWMNNELQREVTREMRRGFDRGVSALAE